MGSCPEEEMEWSGKKSQLRLAWRSVTWSQAVMCQGKEVM